MLDYASVLTPVFWQKIVENGNGLFRKFALDRTTDHHNFKHFLSRFGTNISSILKVVLKPVLEI